MTKFKKIALFSALIAMAVLAAGIIKYTNARKEELRLAQEEQEKIIAAQMQMEQAYADAIELYEKGEYSKAKEAFEELGDYEECEQYIYDCNYFEAVAILDTEDWFAAWEALEKFEGYADADENIELCRENIYNSAIEDMYCSEFESARDKFKKLGDYKRSEKQLELCIERIADEGAFEQNELITPYRYVTDFEEGSMYICPLGYYYIPNEITENTAWSIYFPGGTGTGYNLSIESVWQQHTQFNADAVMIWLYDNGFWDISGYVRTTLWDMMKQLALECDIWFHDVATIGSSNGCFSAIMAAPELYREGITVDNVLAFDAGHEWEVQDLILLNEEQMELLAESKTTVYLMEQHNFTDYFTEVGPVMDLIDSGSDIIIVECRNDGHNHIGPDSIRAGGILYVINQQNQFDSDGFTFWKVYSDGSKEAFVREPVVK